MGERFGEWNAGDPYIPGERSESSLAVSMRSYDRDQEVWDWSGEERSDVPPSSPELFENSHEPLLTAFFLPKRNPGSRAIIPSNPPTSD
jgi:hypothetical protein